MSLNRKYAALPDLDSAPDIYETPDLTDDNSTAPTGKARSNSTSSSYKDFDEADDSTEGISRSHLHVDNARTLFSPAQVDARDADFSDRVTAKRKSYKTSTRRQRLLHDGADRHGEFSDEEDVESLERKLARLRREIEEVREGFGRRHAENREAKVTIVLEDDIKGLSRILNGLSATQINTTQKPSKSKSLVGTLHQQEESQNSRGLVLPGMYPAANTDPSQQSHALAKAVDFDGRLALLEKAFGLSTITTPLATPIDQSKSLFSTLNTLQHQISILSESTPSSLDNIARQVRTLSQEADRLEESRKAARVAQDMLRAAGGDVVDTDGEDSEQVAKVNALYGTLSTIENLAPLLPLLLDRLRSLRAVHAEAATASQNLSEAERNQAKMAEDIKRWKEGLEKVEEAVRQNGALMGGNAKVIEGWVKELEKKVESL